MYLFIYLPEMKQCSGFSFYSIAYLTGSSRNCWLKSWLLCSTHLNDHVLSLALTLIDFASLVLYFSYV